MALVESGNAAGDSRAAVLNSVSADLALDVVQVHLTRLNSHQERPYMNTREMVLKTFKKAREVGGLSDREAVQRTVAVMAKYRKKKGD